MPDVPAPPPEYSDAVARLAPWFREGEAALRTFQDHAQKGLDTSTAPGAWELYKGTPVYQDLLSRHWATHLRLEEAADRIVAGLHLKREPDIYQALAFLSLRHRPFRSGYACGRIARALKKVPLEERHLDLLRRIVLDRVTWTWASSIDLWRCIPKLRTPAFDAALETLADHDVPWIRERAARLVRRYLRD